MTSREVSEAEFDEQFGRPTGGASPAGEVSEALFDAAFGGNSSARRSLEENVTDFERVGLLPDIAERAARALDAGTYGSFEEAAIMCASDTRAHGKPVCDLDMAELAAVLQERKII